MPSETIIFSLPEKRFLNTLLLGIVLPLADATALNTALPALGVSFPVALWRGWWWRICWQRLQLCRCQQP